VRRHASQCRGGGEKVKVQLEELPASMSAPEAMADDAIEIHPGTPNIYYEQKLPKGEETKSLTGAAASSKERSLELTLEEMNCYEERHQSFSF
jgi:aldehyde oxidoreductase